MDSLLDPHVVLQAVRDEDGVIVDFVYVDANPAACAYNRTTYEELIGARLLDLLPGYAAAGLLAGCAHTVETGEPLVLDDVAYDQEILGEARRYDVRAVKVDDGLSYTWRDVTEDFRMRRDLEAALDLLERAGEIAHIGGWELDLLTGHRIWSPETFRIFGVDPAAMPTLEDGLLRFLSDDSQRVLLDTMHDAAEQDRPWDVELQAVTATGRSIWIRVQGYAVKRGEGPTLLRGAVQDITAFKAAEAATVRLERRLRQITKMEAIGRLAGGVAHDFNNMLAVILGRAEVALSTQPPGTPPDPHMVEIREAASRAADLTRQLLVFASQQTVETRVVDLNELVGERLGLLRRLIGEDIEIAWRPADRPLHVEADPSQIDQLLTNLCVNARDAIAGAGTIELSTCRRSVTEDDAEWADGVSPGEYVQLTVSDSGRGMDAETQARVFEPFFTTKGPHSTGGLGLATVYGIAVQHHGGITVSSTPGVGTTFEVMLPAYAGPVAERAAAATARMPTGGERILLVEDEPALLRVATMALRAHGYEVVEVTTADAAVAAVEQSRQSGRSFDLLVTDVIMPGMNGRDLADALAGRGLDAPVLFMSGYPADVIARNGVVDAGVPFIAKPFTLAGLLSKVRAVLDA